MKFAYLLTWLFAWTLYTRQLDYRPSNGRTSQTQTEEALARHTLRAKRQQRKQSKRKWQPRPRYRERHLAHTTSRPQSVRHLNQKSLRRMYRNS